MRTESLSPKRQSSRVESEFLSSNAFPLEVVFNSTRLSLRREKYTWRGKAFDERNSDFWPISGKVWSELRGSVSHEVCRLKLLSRRSHCGPNLLRWVAGTALWPESLSEAWRSGWHEKISARSLVACDCCRGDRTPV